MALTDIMRPALPFPAYSPKEEVKEKKAVVDVEKFSKAGVRLFSIKSFALDHGFGLGLRGRFEIAPYDFNRIIQAVETDSFVFQAFQKYKELIWKEGWDIVGEDPDAVEYLYERIGYMEFVMRRPFQDLLGEISDQLVKFNNAFVAKSRSSDFDAVGSGVVGQDSPIAGYYVIPAETVEIERNKHNKPLKYRQRVDSIIGFGNGQEQPVWLAKDVIHFTLNRRPGAAYGTPFIEPVLDDVIALRQMEEDIQNLVHKELFPLYKYTVGSELNPASDDEIANALDELENLRTDGGLVLPERHDVDVVGAQDNALDASPYLEYFLTRVISGMGLSTHHLGVMNQGGNRAVTDRLDTALYDKVKTYQKYIADMIRLHIFTELLLEGGFNPLTPAQSRGVSSRCEFRFREIDIDSAIKKETHEAHKFNSNLASQAETRLKMNMTPEVDENGLQQAIMTRLQPQPNPSPGGENSKGTPAKSQGKGQANPKKTSKGSGNVIRPANQYGTRTSPNVRNSVVSESLLSDIVELLDDNEEE